MVRDENYHLEGIHGMHHLLISQRGPSMVVPNGAQWINTDLHILPVLAASNLDVLKYIPTTMLLMLCHLQIFCSFDQLKYDICCFLHLLVIYLIMYLIDLLTTYLILCLLFLGYCCL